MMNKDSATNPFYVIFHPFNASYDIRFKNMGSFVISIIILVVWFFAAIMVRQNTGFIFNRNKLNDLNIFLIFAKVMIPFIMWVIGNWVISILMNGTGRFKDIWIFSSYCAVPYILALLLGVFLSNILVMNEPFADYVLLFGSGWSLILLFVGTMVMHEFGFKGNILACICSVGVMAVLLFLMMLVGSLYTEFINFIQTVVYELMFRL